MAVHKDFLPTRNEHVHLLAYLKHLLVTRQRQVLPVAVEVSNACVVEDLGIVRETDRITH